MKNKIVLITGANGGLGEVFVKNILQLSPKKIYCAARNIENLENIQKLSNTIEVVQLDITDKKSIENIASKIDTLDILINNAGINTNKGIFDNQFLDMEVNFKGTVNLTEAFFSKLQTSQGTVINISSILALINLPAMSSYCVSKSALHSFTQALRAQFTQFGGEVYGVLPGPIDTKMTASSPMPKTKPQEIVEAVLLSVKNKEYDIYPDAFSKDIYKRLSEDKAKLIEEFASFI